ncbi:MAG: peptidylprolyl isomerase [Candidatus Thiodiazotropha sp. (ex Dulcina madagascariensis)]|nr:peptidylprolyl isomerase [Candidatus Thiodiazotropha sp. (ex Dulcina madagascariensis)]
MQRFLTLISCCFLATAAWGEAGVPAGEQPSGILARVDDSVITFSQLNTQLNSTAVVGLSTPALGTPERRTVMLALLDKAISVNLLYLDAVNKGLKEDPQYQQEMKDYADGMLVGLYRKHYLNIDVAVGEEEIVRYKEKHFAKGADLDERLRPLIEAKIKKAKYVQRKAGLQKHLRTGLNVKIYSEHLLPEEDDLRSDDQLIAEVGEGKVSWGEVKKYLITLNNAVDLERRLASLDELIDNDLLAKKGREAGLEQDPGYRSALAEFSKTRLVNRYRSELVRGMEPTTQELRDYYAKHRQHIAFKEHRKLQMAVLRDQETAQQLKAKIEKDELTLYQVAMDYSIDPRARQTMGDFGWVEEGSGFPELDELAFVLEVGELGGPVQTPAGWHLLVVSDQRPSRYTDIDDDETQAQTRRLLLKEKLNAYVVGLRKQDYPVMVYADNLNRLMQEEAQWIAAKSKEMEANPERARLILDEMRSLVE